MKDRLNHENEFYQILLSARQKSTQKYLGEAIAKAVEKDNEKRKVAKTIQYNFEIVRSQDTPELSIIDYLLWALHRYIINGEERFFKALQPKFNLIIDLYDFENHEKDISNYYDERNLFSKEKLSIFRTDGYV